MAIEITSREFYYSINSGDNFSDSAEFSDYLKALPGERVKLVSTYKVSFQAVITSGEQFTFTSGQCIRVSGSFITDGFVKGDTFKYYDDANVYQFTGTILSITDTVITYTEDAGSAPSGTITDLGARFRFNGTPNAIRYRFGIIANSEFPNYINKATGLEQLYFCDLNGPSFSYENAVPVTYNFETGSLEFKATAPDDEFTTNYECTHFFINPYYDLSLESDYENGTVPTVYQGSSAMRYVSEIGFERTPGVVNANKSFLDDNGTSGASRWYNQNVNYQAPKYSITSLAFSVDSVPVTSINPGVVTHVVAVITAGSSVITSATRLNIFLSAAKIPAFIDPAQDLRTIMIYSSWAGDLSDTGTIGDIANVTSTVDSGTQFTLEFDVDGVNTTLLSPGDKFILGIGAGKEALTLDATDKLMMLASFDVFADVSADITGQVDFGDMTFCDYKNYKGNPGTPSADFIKVWPEKELGLDFAFGLNLTNASDSPAIQAVEFQLIAKRVGSILGPDNVFVLQSYSFPISKVTTYETGGYSVDRINISAQRGYNCAAQDPFDQVTIDTAYNNSLAPTVANYSGYIGFKVDWQDWIANSGVDTAFYDSTKLNNNMNNLASNYSEQKGYSIYARIKVTTQTEKGGVFQLTEYNCDSVKMIVEPYDEDGLGPNWTQVVKLYDANNNAIPKLKYGERMKMVIDYTRATNTGLTAPDMRALHRIEPVGSPSPFFIEYMGSDGSVIPNLQQKFSNGTLTGVEINVVGANRVTTTNYIDGTKLTPNVQYKLSGELIAD